MLHPVATDERRHGTSLCPGDEVHGGLYDFSQYRIRIVGVVQFPGEFAQRMGERVRLRPSVLRCRPWTPRTAAIGHEHS